MNQPDTLRMMQSAKPSNGRDLPIRPRNVLLLLLLLAGCQFEAKQRPVLELDRSNPTLSGSRYPALASDDPDRVVMAWVSSIEERVSTLEIAERIETQWYAPEPVHVGEDLGRTPADRPQLALMNDGTRWVAWRDLDRGGRLVLSRQEEGARRWVHDRISLGAEEGEQGVPRLATDGTRLVALWREQAGGESTLRLARRDTVMEGAEGRLDNGEGPGGWRPVGVPIPVRGELLGEPALLLADDHVRVSWMHATADGEQVRIMTTRMPLTEMEAAPERVEIGSWTAATDAPVGFVTLTMASQPGERVAVTASLEREEAGERISRLFLMASGEWMEATPESWTPQVGRAVVRSGPDGGWILLWQEAGEPLATLWLQRFTADGSPRSGEPLGTPVRIGSVEEAPLSGVAELIPLTEEGIFLSWTQTDPFLMIRTALLPWDYDPES